MLARKCCTDTQPSMCSVSLKHTHTHTPLTCALCPWYTHTPGMCSVSLVHTHPWHVFCVPGTHSPPPPRMCFVSLGTHLLPPPPHVLCVPGTHTHTWHVLCVPGTHIHPWHVLCVPAGPLLVSTTTLSLLCYLLLMLKSNNFVVVTFVSLFLGTENKPRISHMLDKGSAIQPHSANFKYVLA
jgi:hypothetical protein